LLLAAFRAPHPFGDVLEARIPAAESAEGVWFGGALVAAGRALQYQGVLAELVTQFVDMEFARHAANFRSRPT
jgi:hypothetical protein